MFGKKIGGKMASKNKIKVSRITTVYGVEVSHIAEIIDWFENQGFDPRNWKEFKKELKWRKMV